MQRLEVSCAVRPTYGSLGFKRLINKYIEMHGQQNIKKISKTISINNKSIHIYVRNSHVVR